MLAVALVTNHTFTDLGHACSAVLGVALWPLLTRDRYAATDRRRPTMQRRPRPINRHPRHLRLGDSDRPVRAPSCSQRSVVPWPWRSSPVTTTPFGAALTMPCWIAISAAPARLAIPSFV